MEARKFPRQSETRRRVRRMIFRLRPLIHIHVTYKQTNRLGIQFAERTIPVQFCGQFRRTNMEADRLRRSYSPYSLCFYLFFYIDNREIANSLISNN